VRRLALGAALCSSVIGCGGQHAAPTSRSVAAVRQAFAQHGIHLARVDPSLGPRLRYTALFGESGSLAVSVQVYPKVPRHGSVMPAGEGKPHILAARNVLVVWQGADSPSVEAAVNELR